MGESAEVAIAIPAHGHHVAGVETLLGRFADVTYAYRFGPPRMPGSGPGWSRTRGSSVRSSGGCH